MRRPRCAATGAPRRWFSTEQLNHEIDLSTVDFDFLTQHKRETTSGKPTGDVPLQPAKESGPQARLCARGQRELRGLNGHTSKP
jgi:hypothetical protein